MPCIRSICGLWEGEYAAVGCGHSVHENYILPVQVQPLSILAAVGIFVLLIKWAIDWFLDTEIGLAIRATGDNTKMIRSFFANTDNMKIIGLSVSASGLIRWI
nr:hypothetical protein [Paenibacillus larvae]